MPTMKKATLKTIEQNDNVRLYSICFDGTNESEFENFLLKFRDNAKLNSDFRIILFALEKIIDKGALERFSDRKAKCRTEFRQCRLIQEN